MISLKLNETIKIVDAIYLNDDDMVTLMGLSSQINIAFLIVGIFGNILSIYAYLQRSMRKHKFNCYLLLMALFELIFCIILFTDYLFRLFYVKPMFLHDLNVYTNMAIDYLLHLVDSYVTMLSLIMSIDRIYAIKNPTELNNFITYVHPKRIALTALFTLIIFKIPGIIVCYHESEMILMNTLCCTILLPTIFNVLPTVVILMINCSLILKIINYYKNLPKILIIRISNSESSSTMNKSLQRPLCRVQKSHHFVIIVSSMWLVLTTIPYYTFNFFHLLFNPNLFRVNIDLKLISKMQIISSILFNLNHCLNFFIYFGFNNEFRMCIYKPIRNIYFFVSRKIFSTSGLELENLNN